MAKRHRSRKRNDSPARLVQAITNHAYAISLDPVPATHSENTRVFNEAFDDLRATLDAAER